MEKFQISHARRSEEVPHGLRRAFPGLFLKERGGLGPPRSCHFALYAAHQPSMCYTECVLLRVDMWNGAGVLLLFLLLYAGEGFLLVTCPLLCMTCLS